MRVSLGKRSCRFCHGNMRVVAKKKHGIPRNWCFWMGATGRMSLAGRSRRAGQRTCVLCSE